jgi:hypothetical protein
VTKQDTLDNQVLAQTYGFNLAFFRDNPDLNKLFKTAVKQNYTPEEFIARLRGTGWFKKHGDTARQWLVLNATDPGTAKQRLNQRMANVTQMLGRSGVASHAGYVDDLARKSLLLGWDDAQLSAVIAKSFDYNPDKVYQGTGGDAIAAVKKTAADYLVPVSDGTIERWARATIAGTATVDDYTNWAKEQAKSLMPALTKQIDAGMTVRDLVDPYAQIAAKTLGINPEAIDFTQSKWRKAVDQVDPTTGDRTMSSLTDWETQLMKDPTYGYDKSTPGRERGAQFATKLAQTMGAL